MDHRVGSIEVICGSMFCGKTDELIRRLRRAEIARKTVQVFKPAIDNRYEEQRVASHAGSTFDAVAINSANEIMKNLKDETTVVESTRHNFSMNPLLKFRNIWQIMASA